MKLSKLMDLKGIYDDYLPFLCGSLVVIWQVIFFYFPLIFVFAYSFLDYSVFNVFQSVLVSNYILILIRSIIFALITAFICLIISYPVAYFLAFHAGKLTIPLFFMIIVPFWTNFLLHICSWFFILDRKGLISTFLQRMGLIKAPLSMLNSWWAIAIVLVYFYLPFMLLPIYSELERFNRNLLEASLDLGASWIQTIFRVLIPITMPGIRTGILLVFIPVCGEFVIPEFMGGDRWLFIGSVISRYMLDKSSFAQASAFTVLSLLLILGVVKLIFWVLDIYVSRRIGE